MQKDKEIANLVSRPIAFAYWVVAKLWHYSLVPLVLVIAYGCWRDKLADCRIGVDIGFLLTSFIYLFVVGWRGIKAWLKSGAMEVRISTRRLIFIAICALIIILMVVMSFSFAYAILLRLIYCKLEERGQFGDSFGVLNSMASTVALIGLWMTVWLQHKQNEELHRQWLEEQDKKKRSKWPAIVLMDINGNVRLINIMSGNEFQLHHNIEFKYKNFSNRLLLNVIARAQVGNANFSSICFDMCANIWPYCEGGAINTYTLKLMDKISDSQQIFEMLSPKACGNRQLRITIYFSTPQREYYSVEQDFLIRVADLPANKPVVAAYNKILGAKCDNTLTMNLFKDELSKMGITSEDIKLEFESVISAYKLSEINEKMFNEIASRGRPSIMR